MKPEWLRDKKVTIFMQYTVERLRELPDVPTLAEISPPDKRPMAEFIASGTPFARALAVGPGVPKDRVAALRKAFDDLMQDQEFLARRQEAQARHQPAQRRGDARAAGEDHRRLARVGRAGHEGDRVGLHLIALPISKSTLPPSSRVSLSKIR